MHNFATFWDFVFVTFTVLALVASVMGIYMCIKKKPSRLGIVLIVSPPLLMAGLFYSLALHMHLALGAWPTSIGEDGFPSSLVTHEQITELYFAAVFLASLFIWPIAFLLCLFIGRFRSAIPYLGLYALSFVICFVSMMLAPSPFLDWWWD